MLLVLGGRTKSHTADKLPEHWPCAPRGQPALRPYDFDSHGVVVVAPGTFSTMKQRDPLGHAAPNRNFL